MIPNKTGKAEIGFSLTSEETYKIANTLEDAPEDFLDDLKLGKIEVVYMWTQVRTINLA